MKPQPVTTNRATFSSAELARQTIYRRAVEMAIWGMPIVSFDAMRQGFFNIGAKYGDIVYFTKPADWHLQLTTPNASSLYIYFNFNLRYGALVLDIPAAEGAGIFGSIMDAWQVPLADVGPAGEDRGKGAKYLLLPPDFNGDIPDGYIPVCSATYNGYALFRAIPITGSEQDTAKALLLVKRLQLYHLRQTARPPATKHIDIAGKMFEGLVNFTDSFYDSLAKMVNEEFVQEHDMIALSQLRSIGIEKGKGFNPDPSTRAILRHAIVEAQAGFMDAVTRITPYWPGSKWGSQEFISNGAKSMFSFQTATGLDIDGRGALYFSACAAPKRLGAATCYLLSANDAIGVPLEGGRNYRLHIPPNVPAKQFWAVTVYDLETCAFIRDSQKIEINSYQNIQKNEDGSVDVYFGPKPLAGHQSNWIYTATGKRWFAIFRFYGPEKAIRDKTWLLPDIEALNSFVS